MRYLLYTFLTITLIANFYIGYLVFTPQTYLFDTYAYETLKYVNEDIEISLLSAQKDREAVNITTYGSKTSQNGCISPEQGSKEAIRCQIKEIAEDTPVDWEELWILAKHESRWNPEAVNINPYEASYGLYQINTKVHNVTPAQAKDIEFATKWTINNLIKNGYQEDYKIIPLAKHQGSPSIPVVLSRANTIYYEAQNVKVH